MCKYAIHAVRYQQTGMCDIVTYSGSNIVELWDTMLTHAQDKTNPQADTMALLATNYIGFTFDLYGFSNRVAMMIIIVMGEVGN